MCGEGKSEEAKGGVEYLLTSPDAKYQNVDYYWYAHYYAALVMHRVSDEQFRKWYPEVRRAVLQKQQKDGFWYGEGVPEYCTAMALIILSVPFDFVPAYQR
jgi:hypothetical protein